MLALRWDRGTYREGNGARMGGKVLLVGAGCTEFVAGCYHPESNGWIIAYPPMNLVVFVLQGVLVLVINLRPQYHGSQKREPKKKGSPI